MPKVSIITPIYNSERFLGRCVNSILNQTLEDLELILVDDGSTDSSGIICDDYAKNDSRVKVIHNKNSGMGVSYNTGIKMASGKYIGFLESDDMALNNMFEDLYNLAEKQELDIAKSAWFNYFFKQNKHIIDSQLINYKSDDVFNIQTNPDILLIQFSVWSAIYKTDFLRNKNVYFLETPGASYQDVDFSYKAFCLADRISVTPNAYVFYTQDNINSSVNSKEKSEVIFTEYAEVDRLFSENPHIKKHANSSKLVKQYFDYKWNYNRISNNLRPNFIKRFAHDFKKYSDNGEFDAKFYSRINTIELESILSII